MNTLRLSFPAFLLLLFWSPFISFGQMSGTYTVGGVNPDFGTIQEAADTLMSQGISYTVNIKIRPGLYSEAITIGSVPGVSLLDSVVFESENGDSSSVTIDGGGWSGASVTISQAYFITLRKLHIINYGSISSIAVSSYWSYQTRIENCLIESPNCISNNADDASPVIFQYPFSGFVKKGSIRNSMITGTGWGIYIVGPNGSTDVRDCQLLNTGRVSFAAQWCAGINFQNNYVLSETEVDSDGPLTIDHSDFKMDVDIRGGGVSWIKNSLFDGDVASYNMITIGSVFENNVVNVNTDVDATILRNNKFAQASSGYRNNMRVINNEFTGSYNPSFCENLQLIGNIFGGDVDIAFGLNGKYFNNHFYGFIKFAFDNNVHFLNNNLAPSAILDVEYADGEFRNNLLPDNSWYLQFWQFENNNYYPSGGQFDINPTYYDPQYVSPTDLTPTNPMLAGKGVTHLLVEYDIDSIIRLDPPSLGANEICFNQANTPGGIEITCSDSVYLNLCSLPDSGQFVWTPLSGLNNPNIKNPFASPSITTTYYVSEIISGFTDSIIVNVVSPQIMLNLWNDSLTCADSVFIACNIGVPATWDWTPGYGLSDSTSNVVMADPWVSTTYVVTATIPGCGVIGDTLDIWVDKMPHAQFAIVTSYSPVEFANLSGCADSYLWDFGDGNTDTVFAPIHPYDTTGVYLVTLIAYNVYGTDTFQAAIPVLVMGIENPKMDFEVSVYPNPNSGVFNLQLKNLIPGDEWKYSVFTMEGKLLLEKNVGRIFSDEFEEEINMPGIASGLYFLRIENETKSFRKKFIVE